MHFGLQEHSTTHNLKPLHHRSRNWRFALRYFCYAFKYWCTYNQQMELWYNDLSVSRLLRLICRLCLTFNYGFDSCEPLCEDVQVGSAISEMVFSQEITRPARACVDSCCLLGCRSTVGRSSSVQVHPRLCIMLSQSSQRKRENDSLHHCRNSFFSNTIDNDYDQLHKSCKDDPTAQHRCVNDNSQPRQKHRH